MFSDFKIRSFTAVGLAFLSFLVLYLGHFYLKIFVKYDPKWKNTNSILDSYS